MKTLEQFESYRQNVQIALAIEHAERVVDELMKRGVVVAGMEVGRHQCPVIRVHYCAGCEAFTERGTATVPNLDGQTCTVSVQFHNCIIQWLRPCDTVH